MLEPEEPPSPWGAADLVIFGVFFALTFLFLPSGLIQLMRVFRPALKVADLTAVDQVFMQSVMNLVLVGFILGQVKVLHGRSFRDTVSWYPQNIFGARLLVSLGITLAVAGLIVSSVFPPTSPPPIEKLLSTSLADPEVRLLFSLGLRVSENPG